MTQDTSRCTAAGVRRRGVSPLKSASIRLRLTLVYVALLALNYFLLYQRRYANGHAPTKAEVVGLADEEAARGAPTSAKLQQLLRQQVDIDKLRRETLWSTAAASAGALAVTTALSHCCRLCTRPGVPSRRWTATPASGSGSPMTSAWTRRPTCSRCTSDCCTIRAGPSRRRRARQRRRSCRSGYRCSSAGARHSTGSAFVLDWSRRPSGRETRGAVAYAVAALVRAAGAIGQSGCGAAQALTGHIRVLGVSSTVRMRSRRTGSEKGFSTRVTPGSRVPWEARTGWA